MNYHFGGTRYPCLLRSIFAVLSLAIVAPLTKGAQVRIKVALQSLHQIEGWGYWPGGEIHYGSTMVAKTLLSALPSSFVAFTLKSSCFDETALDGTLDQTALEAEVIRPITELQQLAREGYVTTVDTPPRYWKRAYSYNSQEDLLPNSLLKQHHRDYADFLVRLFSEIRNRGLPLPYAHSIQSPINLLTPEVGCFYSAAQWTEFIIQLRSALDGAGFQSIKIVGPDTLSYASALQYLSVLDGRRLPLETELSNAIGILGFSGYFDRSSDGSRTLVAAANLFQRERAFCRQIWMTGWADFSAMNEDQVCLSAARRMAGEITCLGVTRWFWRGGFRTEQNSTALIHSAGTPTQLYRLWLNLWKRAGAGAYVHKVVFDDPAFHANSDEIEENGIAFSNGTALVVLIVNPLAEARNATLETNCDGDGAVWSNASASDQFIAVQSVAPGTFSVTLPPRSITIVECRYSPSAQ